MHGDVTEARISEVLDTVGLGRRGDSRVGGYSHGMKQRLGIAQALMHEPELIILDEPTSGLDPQGMKDVRELVRELGRRGTTVFLSSHLLHEVEQICNRAVIMNKGRIVVQGPVAELRPKDMSVKVLTGDQARALEVLSALCGAGSVVDDGEYLDRARRRRRRSGDGETPGGRRHRCAGDHTRGRAGLGGLLPGTDRERRRLGGHGVRGGCRRRLDARACVRSTVSSAPGEEPPR